jgi:DNA-binding MarR family transcriptional regulator
LKISLDGTLNASEHRILAYFIAILPANLRLEIGHREVAERLDISRPQVSRAMRRLEDRYYFTKLANKVYKFPDRLKEDPFVGGLRSDLLKG